MAFPWYTVLSGRFSILTGVLGTASTSLLGRTGTRHTSGPHTWRTALPSPVSVPSHMRCNNDLWLPVLRLRMDRDPCLRQVLAVPLARYLCCLAHTSPFGGLASPSSPSRCGTLPRSLLPSSAVALSSRSRRQCAQVGLVQSGWILRRLIHNLHLDLVGGIQHHHLSTHGVTVPHAHTSPPSC